MTTRTRFHELIDRLGSTSVLLLGDLVLDRFILGTPKRISREAPVIILRHEGQRDVPGGAANALANLASLGVRAIPVGVVGDDEPGESLLSELASRGIDVSSILVVPGYRTPTKVRILGGGSSSLKHQVARYDIEDRLPDGGSWEDDLLAVLDSRLPEADAVAISDYGYGTTAAAAVAQLLAEGRRASWTCADSRFRIAQLGGVDGVTPNLEELEQVAGATLGTDQDVAAASERLRRLVGARFVLTTRGNRGMTLVENASPALHIPVFGTDEVADVTGAGDTVLAVLTAALAAGATPTEAACMANYGGGVVVMKLGTAAVTRDELLAAVDRDLDGGRE
jgi:rfaE bifunctional protein kinase chain/domain